MKCPTKDCQGEVMEIINFEGLPFCKKFKVINYFCPLCDWQNKKKFQISNLEYAKEMEKLSNTKINKFEYEKK